MLFRLAFFLSLTITTFSASHGFAEPFTNFGGFDTDGPALAGEGRYLGTAPIWFSGSSTSPFPGWDENVRWDWEFSFTGAFAPVGQDPTVIAAPATSTSTIFDVDDEGSVVGTMTWLGTGTFETDVKLESALVDEASGQILTPYSLFETYEITGQTGTFSTLTMESPWMLEVQGRTARGLIPGQDLAEATGNPAISSSSTFVISGEYGIVPEPSGRTLFAGTALLALPLLRGDSRSERR